MHLTQNFAIIVAAGKGIRMGTDVKKQYLCLNKIPVLSRTLSAFDQCKAVEEIFLVIPEEDRSYCEKEIIRPYAYSKRIHLVGGGKHRQDSVYNGLKKVVDQKDPSKETIVLIHDGVRPFVSLAMIETCIRSAIKHGACLPAIKMTDTVKKVSKNFQVEKTVLRQSLYCAQTPQTFKLNVIIEAFEYAAEKNLTATDDASLVEQMGRKVVIVPGSKFNLKLTTPEDLVLGEFVLSQDI